MLIRRVRDGGTLVPLVNTSTLPHRCFQLSGRSSVGKRVS